MLDKSQVINQLSKIVPQAYFDLNNELECAKHCYNWLLNNPNALKDISKIPSQWSMPGCYESLDANIQIEPYQKEYCVLGVDGSQIYPDRHQGIACFLINIGLIKLIYGQNSSNVELKSIPFVSTEIEKSQDLAQDIVNCKRTEFEFRLGLDYSLEIIKNFNKESFLFLFDGSLIFWHLDSKDPETKKKFLTNYIAILNEFYQKQISIAGFISFPKSKEIINIIRTGLENNIIQFNDNKNIDHIVDTDVLSFFLKPNCRTTIFSHNSSIVSHYPNHLKPQFCYLDIGDEIVRIEFPYWMYENKKILTNTFEIIVDQCKKGNGYPIALSEAHEQAVIKNADRYFFYQILNKLTLNHNRHFKTSQKSMKKRLVAV